MISRQAPAEAGVYILVILWLCFALPAGAQGQAALILGEIDFPTSGSGAAQQEFLTGVLALHSFWYEEARVHFVRARQIEPCFGRPIGRGHDLRPGPEEPAGAR